MDMTSLCQFHVMEFGCIPIRRDMINSRDTNKTTTIIMNWNFHTASFN